MIDCNNQHKTKLELKLVGTQSSRTSSNYTNNYPSYARPSCKQTSIPQGRNSQQSCLTPKRNVSGQNITPTSSIYSGNSTPSHQQSSNKTPTNTSMIQKNVNKQQSLPHANFTRKNKESNGISSSILQQDFKGMLSSERTGAGITKNSQVKQKQQTNSNNNNSNANISSYSSQYLIKNPFLQAHLQQQKQQQSPSTSQIDSSSYQNIDIPNTVNQTFSPRMSQHLSPDQSLSSQSISNNKFIKPSNYHLVQSSQHQLPSYSLLQPGKISKQGCFSLNSPSSNIASSALQKQVKGLSSQITQEKGKQVSSQSSFLKKPQLIITRATTTASTTMLNSSSLSHNNTNNNISSSFIKQNHSRSPHSNTDKENTMFGDNSPQLTNRDSPFSYLASKQKQSKSPKGSSSLQMIPTAIGYESTHSPNFFNSQITSQYSSPTQLQPAGNFFTSQLNRKKHQSSSNCPSNGIQSSVSLSPFNRNDIAHTESPMPLSSRRAGAGSASGASTSFLGMSNLKESIGYNKGQEAIQSNYSPITPIQYPINTFNKYAFSNSTNQSEIAFNNAPSYSNSASAIQTQFQSSALNPPRNQLPKSYLSLDSRQAIAKAKLESVKENANSNTKNNNEGNEIELSFQEADEQQLLSMMMLMQGGAEDESNFLNSTNFLNITNTINQTPMIQKYGSNSSMNTSSILPQQIQQQNQGSVNQNMNQHHHNSSNGNWGNSTVAFNNSTQVFNNSTVCANSTLNLNNTLNTILTNMNQATPNKYSSSPMKPVFIPTSSQTIKLALDPSPKDIEFVQEPASSSCTQTIEKSVLYDIIMPTIRPITNQFKLLNSINCKMGTASSTNGNMYPGAINSNIFTQSQQYQFQQAPINNNISNSYLLNNFTNNPNKDTELNQATNLLTPYSDKVSFNPNNLQAYQSENVGTNYCHGNSISSGGLLESDQLTTLNDKNQILQQLTGNDIFLTDSEQSTPIKIHLKVDSQSRSASQNYTQVGIENQPSIPSAQYEITPSIASNISTNTEQFSTIDKDQLAIQQYNFSFSNCVNQQKKLLPQINLPIASDQIPIQLQQYQYQYPSNEVVQLQQYQQQSQQQQQIPQQQQQQQQQQQLKYLQQYQQSPEKPAISMIVSQSITAEGILQLTSQAFSPEKIGYVKDFPDQRLLNGMWSIDSFQLGKCLGRGRFGNVYLARHKPSNILVAIKQISKKNLQESCMEKQLQQEIKIQSYLNHPNILKMTGFFHDDQKINLILELASHGDIYKEIKREHDKRFNEVKAANYIRQICEGLIYLHSQGIIHRDIKPENILNSYGLLKISDFGWSIFTEEKRMTFCGTLDYVSPEVVSGKDYDFKVDIWSVGVLTYELITGKPPFENRSNHNEAYQKILMVKFDFPDFISVEAKDFMSKLLVGDPNKRISLEAALNHEWIMNNTRNCLADWNPKVSEETLYLLR